MGTGSVPWAPPASPTPCAPGHPLGEPTPELPRTSGKSGPFPGPIPPNQDCPGKPPRSHFPPFQPLKTPAGERDRDPTPSPLLTIKASRCDKRTSRSRLAVRVEWCSVPGPAHPSTHGTNTTGAAKPAPTCAAPRGAPAATRHGGDKKDPPTPGITLQNSAQGPRVRIRLLPLAHTSPSQTFRLHPGSSAAAAVEHLPVSPPPHQLGISLHQNAGGGEEDTQIF